MKEFLKNVRWLAVLWVVVWIATAVVVFLFPGHKIVDVLCYFGLSVGVLLTADVLYR